MGLFRLLDRFGHYDDGHEVETMFGKLEVLNEHLHRPSLVYPALANGVTVTTSASAWTLGTKVQIVPASTITALFDIHWISIEAVSANDVFLLELYHGASDTLAGQVRFTKTAIMDASKNEMFMTALIPANSRIRAALACAGGGSKTATISIRYHTYD